MEGSLEDDIAVIKSVISISPGGLLLSNLEREYREMNECRLNFRQYGYKSLLDMLEASPEIKVRQTSNGLICTVHDEKLSHVTALVEEQRKPRKKRNKPKSYRFKTRSTYSNGSYSGPRSSTHMSSPFKSRNSSYSYSSQQPRVPSYSQSQPQYQRQSSQQRNDTNFNRQYSNRQTDNTYQYRNSQDETKNVGRRLQSVIVAPVAREHSNRSEDSARRFGYLQSSAVSSSSDQRFDSSNRTRQNTFSSKGDVSIKVPKPVSNNSYSSDNWSSKSNFKESHVNLNTSQNLPKVKNSQSFLSSAPVEKNLSSSFARMELRNQSLSCVSSDSDWSSSDTEVPFQGSQALNSGLSISSDLKLNGASKKTSVEETNNLKKKLWDDPGASKSDCVSQSPISRDPPLMVGGVGRGKRLLNLIKSPGKSSDTQGINQSMDRQPQSTRQEATQPVMKGRGVTITGSPVKREAVVTSINGLKTILVSVPNQDNISKSVSSSEPYLHDYQLIGDNLLLEVADKCLGFKHHNGGTGFCRKNLTISQCHRQSVLKAVGVSRKILMMIGMTDILQGASFKDLKERMESLRRTLGHHHLILMTLPTLPCLINEKRHKELSVLMEYNNWLCSLPSDKVIDLEPHLFCKMPHFKRISDELYKETLSDEGCWIVMHEICEFLHVGK